MKTDELIAMLASGAAPVEANAGRRRLAMALGWGLFGATLLMAVLLGVRPDLVRALSLPMFWMKLGVPLLAALAALQMVWRLGVPGTGPGRAPLLLSALLLLAWSGAAVMLMSSAPERWTPMLFGTTWKTCPFNIALLSSPVFVAAFWAMRGMAPTRPAQAGAAAGLLAGAAGAAVYALHCPEMAAPFLGVWYVLGMAIPAVAGAVLGSRLLRW
jgi:hypothetical protein